MRFLITHKVRLIRWHSNPNDSTREILIDNPIENYKRVVLLNNWIWDSQNNDKTSLFIIKETNFLKLT